MSPQASPPRKRAFAQKGVISKVDHQKDSDKTSLRDSAEPKSPERKRLLRQSTETSETSACFVTPPTSPLNQSGLSPVKKSPVTWNSNPLYKDTERNSPTRSRSYKSTFSSPGAETPSPTSTTSVRSTSRSSSVNSSPSGTGSRFNFPHPDRVFTSGVKFCPSTKASNNIDNQSSVVSQQSVNSSSEPPPPPARKDSINKARKNSRKLDAENMLYGPLGTMHESSERLMQVHVTDRETRSKSKVGSQVEGTEPKTRERTLSLGERGVGEPAMNGQADAEAKAPLPKLPAEKLAHKAAGVETSRSYLDGFLIDAPDNTLIKPSKLRESMRKNRAKRAQTAPVDRQDVDKALDEINRKWGKRDRDTALSHLPLADRLAFRKMRSEREQNNNEINKFLKKDSASNVTVNKVLTASTSADVSAADSMTTPATAQSTSTNVTESATITPVLHLSRTDPESRTGNRSPSPKRTVAGTSLGTVRHDPVSPTRFPAADTHSQGSPVQQDVVDVESFENRFSFDRPQDRLGRSNSQENHVSAFYFISCAQNTRNRQCTYRYVEGWPQQ